jgi:hypothetical protein
MDRLLIPLDEARHRLGGIGRTKLHQLLANGEITCVHVGRRAFVLAESVSSFVSRLSETATDVVAAGTPGETASTPSETAGTPVSRD